MKRALVACSLGTFVVWLALPGSPALACTCERLAIPAQVAGANAVFAARVVGVTSTSDHSDVAVHVERVYKGSPPAALDVRTPASESACGIQFAREDEYLVFARADGGTYLTSLCDGTTDDLGMLDRAGYAGRELVAVAAAQPRRAPARTAPIAGAAVALAGVFALHARRFARS